MEPVGIRSGEGGGGPWALFDCLFVISECAGGVLGR